MPTPAYLWFDAEFTSLDLESACFLQIACMATDHKLNRLCPPEEDVNLAVRLPEGVAVSKWVEEHIPMIVAASRSVDAKSVEEVDQALVDYIQKTTGAPSDDISKRPIIAGNSVHVDWHLSRRLLPNFVARCHYRLLDVSALKVQWTDHFGGAPLDKDNPDAIRAHFPSAHFPRAMAHDAYYDVQASAAELAYVRTQLERAR